MLGYNLQAKRPERSSEELGITPSFLEFLSDYGNYNKKPPAFLGKAGGGCFMSRDGVQSPHYNGNFFSLKAP